MMNMCCAMFWKSLKVPVAVCLLLNLWKPLKNVMMNLFLSWRLAKFENLLTINFTSVMVLHVEVD